MKRILLFILSSVFAVNVFSSLKEVELNGVDDESIGQDQRNIAPTVNYDEKNVWIKSKELIPDANIVIKDAGNKVIYQGSMPLSPSASVISLPVDNDKYSIELSYGKKNFSGFFVE